MARFVGLDVSQKLTSIYVVDETGRRIWRGQCSTDPVQLERIDAEFAQVARTDPTARLLTTIPGIGTINATALAAAVSRAQTFGRGRDLAAWLGLVPRQMTTGGKPKLLGISKRSNVYLRKMLIHGARAALPMLSAKNTPLGGWLRNLLARAHTNTVVVALAAKLARIVWHHDKSLADRAGHTFFNASCASRSRFGFYGRGCSRVSWSRRNSLPTVRS